MPGIVAECAKGTFYIFAAFATFCKKNRVNLRSLAVYIPCIRWFNPVVDSLTPEERSKLMGKIRGKNTKPELLVRSMLHRAGYRFSLHRKDLPGKPDIVLRKYNTVVFVHGCFWHRHKNCKIASTPKSNVEFWQAKFDRNVANDKKHTRKLREMGWHVLTVWECELKKPEKVLQRLEILLAARERIEHENASSAAINLTFQVSGFKYPSIEDAELPMAAEKQAGYSTKGEKRKKNNHLERTTARLKMS